MTTFPTFFQCPRVPRTTFTTFWRLFVLFFQKETLGTWRKRYPKIYCSIHFLFKIYVFFFLSQNKYFMAGTLNRRWFIIRAPNELTCCPFLPHNLALNFICIEYVDPYIISCKLLQQIYYQLFSHYCVETYELIGPLGVPRDLHEGARSQRINVVFDVYSEDLIKNTERENRGSASAVQYSSVTLHQVTGSSNGENF